MHKGKRTSYMLLSALESNVIISLYGHRFGVKFHFETQLTPK